MGTLFKLFGRGTKDGEPSRATDETVRITGKTTAIGPSPSGGVSAGTKKVVLVGTQHSNPKEADGSEEDRVQRAMHLYVSLARDSGDPPRPSSGMAAPDIALKSTRVPCSKPTEGDHAQDRYPICLIVEYGPFEGLASQAYEDKCLPHIVDFRQHAYIKAARSRRDVRVIGADGRKRYLKEFIMGLSIKQLRYGYDQKDYSYGEGADLSPEAIQAGLRTYMAFALGIHDLASETPLDFLEKMVIYKKAPSPPNIRTQARVVLENTFHLVQTHSRGLNRDWKEAIFEHVLTQYEEDCPKERPERLGTEEEEFHKGVEEFREDFGWEPDEEALKGIRRGVIDALGAAEEAARPWVDACYDAVCNLLLFTRVLAEHTREQHVVVAFGRHHITPLYALLSSLGVQTEKGPMTL